MKLYCDGASRGNPGQSSIGVVIYTQDIDKQARLELSYNIGITTNNVAEYNSLVEGLKAALEVYVLDNPAPHLSSEENCTIQIFMDSQLVVRQIKQEYKVKDKKLLPLYKKANNLLNNFASYNIHHIPREQNTEADKLAKKSIDRSYKHYN